MCFTLVMAACVMDSCVSLEEVLAKTLMESTGWFMPLPFSLVKRMTVLKLLERVCGWG